MAGLTVVFLGQMISHLGTGITSFALTIWIWQSTGRAMSLALAVFFTFAPTVLLSPVAGVLADRWSRRLVLILSDLGSGLVSLAVLFLWHKGLLGLAHVYSAAALSGAFQAFQFPALSAAIGQMVPRKDYARASGMHSMVQSTSSLAAPLAAGMLLGLIHLGGILALDVCTFVAAVLALLVVPIPHSARRTGGRMRPAKFWRDAAYGFHFIARRPALLGLQGLLATTNLIRTSTTVLLPALILARSANDEVALGIVQSATGAGAMLGGLLLTTWGGPRRRISGVLFGVVGASLAGGVLMGLGRALAIWATAGFLGALLGPIVNGCNQAIWLAKTPSKVQGRVFSARLLIAQITIPCALLMAGPLADRIFEPAMMPGAAWAGVLGDLLGSGPGAGTALLFVLAGICGIGVGLGGYFCLPIREVEQRLPDMQEACPANGPE